MAIATTTALLIGATALGSVVSAAGAIQQGKAAQAQANYNAALQNQQAEIQRQQAQTATEQAAANEQAFRTQEERAMATRRAMLGGAGIETSTGSPLLTSQDFASEAELQALRIRNGGQVASTRLDQQAQLTDLAAAGTRAAGANAASSSYFRAGASLLSGIGSAANIYGGASNAWGRTGIPLTGVNLNSVQPYNPANFYIPNG